MRCMMALEHVKRFIDQLKSDEQLRYRFEAFIAAEGYSFPLSEITITEKEELKESPKKRGYKRDFSNLRGYEHWEG